MRDAHCGIGYVDMLPASTAGTIGVNTKVFLVYIHFDIVVDLW